MATTTRKTYEELGNIMLAEAGAPACMTGYATTDPREVGILAISWNDINWDGTLN